MYEFVQVYIRTGKNSLHKQGNIWIYKFIQDYTIVRIWHGKSNIIKILLTNKFIIWKYIKVTWFWKKYGNISVIIELLKIFKNYKNEFLGYIIIE